AAFVSVSNTIGIFRARLIVPTISVFFQPGLGVLVMYPKDFDVWFRSMGPNDPMPIAEIGSVALAKNSITWKSVSSGVVVRIVLSFKTWSGSDPMMQENLVPPA